MRQTLSLAVHHIWQYSAVLLPLALLFTSVVTARRTPVRHALTVHAASWAAVCGYNALRVGVRSGWENKRRRKLTLGAGAFFAVALVCERATGEKEGFWWTQSLLPLAVYFILRSDFELVPTQALMLHDDEHAMSDRSPKSGSGRMIAVAAGSASAVLSTIYSTPEVTTLGLCSATFKALALVLFDSALNLGREDRSVAMNGLVSANGSLLRRAPNGTDKEHDPFRVILRDFAGTIMIICTIGAVSFESFKVDGIAYRREYGVWKKGEWKALQPEWRRVWMINMVLIETAKNILLMALIRQNGPTIISLYIVGGYILTSLVSSCNLCDIWFTILFIIATATFFDLFNSASQRRKKIGHLALVVLAGISFVVLGLRNIHTVFYPQQTVWEFMPTVPPSKPMAPLEVSNKKVHPIEQLVQSSEKQFQALLAKQSKTLEEAVAEYRRRYQMPPPPNFDKWYEFAKNNGVQLIDEFDHIYHSLLPFWALDPVTIRGRVAEAIGYDGNSLIALLIRGGEGVKIDGGPDWQQRATLGMIEKFVRYLPDMDLAFNVHDEPRIVVPNDKLTRLVNKATSSALPKAFANREPRNFFSPRPKDMGDGTRVAEVKTTRFNEFAHQPTWSHSRMSCPPDSPARNFEDIRSDNLTSYALTELGFVYNETAFSDICMSPSLSHTYGFFDRPNAFNIASDLIPIFSQSKVNSFQDILYPSPWYWFEKVHYEEERDMPWDRKQNKMYWRGSTTGGFSRDGGWRRQHRQHVVKKLNGQDEARILAKDAAADGQWALQKTRREDHRDLIDVAFSHVGQCDPGDCDAQREFFNVGERVEPHEAWGFRHLLDMDGNAFSGRFYAFLKSHSLVYKMAVFQEWHKDWLKPWVHYVPISLRGEDWLEAVRYFALEGAGMEQAPRMAERGREWAGKVLRNEDFEAWFFRLLLEYGRLIDDNRETIGYAGP